MMPREEGNFVNDPATKTVGWTPDPEKCKVSLGLEAKQWPVPHSRASIPDSTKKNITNTDPLFEYNMESEANTNSRNVMASLPLACTCPSNEQGREKCQAVGCMYVASACKVHARCAFCSEPLSTAASKTEAEVPAIFSDSPIPSPSVLLATPKPKTPGPFEQYAVKENYHDEWKQLPQPSPVPTQAPKPWRDGGEGWEAKFLKSRTVDPQH